MTVALMWEARAREGRGGELLAWATAQELTPAPLRRETFRAPQDRVLVITWWDAPYDAELPELPEPAAESVTRPVHRWRFESIERAWYAVRCVFHHTRLGTYEERITLWTAHSPDEAIARAEAEAAEYCEDFDGVEYVRFAEVFTLGGPLGEGTEAFSLMRESTLPPEQYVRRFFATGAERTG